MIESPRCAAGPTIPSMAEKSIGMLPTSVKRCRWAAGTSDQLPYGSAPAQLNTTLRLSTPLATIESSWRGRLTCRLSSGPSAIMPTKPWGTRAEAAAGTEPSTAMVSRTDSSRRGERTAGECSHGALGGEPARGSPIRQQPTNQLVGERHGPSPGILGGTPDAGRYQTGPAGLVRAGAQERCGDCLRVGWGDE